MRIALTNINPLKDLIDILPEVAKPLLEEDLSRISLMLAAGGVICETEDEVVDALRLLEELKVVELSYLPNNTISIRKLI
jgi:glycerol-3-phosphate responsive antiterminator